jgi:hypothetical protein
MEVTDHFYTTPPLPRKICLCSTKDIFGVDVNKNKQQQASDMHSPQSHDSTLICTQKSSMQLGSK